MLSRAAKPLVLSVLLWAGAACHKDADLATDVPVVDQAPPRDLQPVAPLGGGLEPAGRDARVARAKSLPTGAYFAYIPQDTPYVLASFEPFSEDVMKAMLSGMAALRPVLQMGKKEIKGNTQEDKFLRALADEMLRLVKPGGLKKAGFSLSPQYAFYGLGPYPVFRLELADGRKVKRMTQRLMRKGKFKPKKKRVLGKEVWLFDEFIVGIFKKELVIAWAPPDKHKAVFPPLLEAKNVVESMATSTALKEVAVRHGFSGVGAGWVDFTRLYDGALGKTTGVSKELWADVSHELGGKSAPCLAGTLSVVQQFPRVALGYNELSTKVMSFSMIWEMAPQFAAALSPLVAKVPGFAPELLRTSKFAVGAAVKVPQARKLLGRVAGGLGALASACDSGALKEASQGLRGMSEKTLPAPWERTRGAYAVLEDVSLAGGMPSQVEAHLAVHTWAPKKLLALAQPLVEGQVSLSVPHDGAFHRLTFPLADPFANGVYLAVLKHGLHVAIGTKGKERAEARKSAPRAASPFFLIGYDPVFFFDAMKATTGGRMGEAETAIFDSMKAIYKGPVGGWMYPNEHGLAFSFEMVLERP